MLDSRLEHNLHIFVNSVEFIAKVIDLAKLTPDKVKVVCSTSGENSENNQRKLGKDYPIGQPSDPVRKINFYTSTCFEGCDLYDKNGVTFIVSDGNKSHTLLDISTLFTQICGRLRDSKYKGEIIHVYSTTKYSRDVTLDEFVAATKKTLQEAVQYADEINSLSDTAREKTLSKIKYINEQYVRIEDNRLVVDKNFANMDIVNFKICRHIYRTYVNLTNELQRNGYTITRHTFSEIMEKIENKANARVTFKELFDEYHRLKTTRPFFSLDNHEELCTRIALKYPLVKQAYDELGTAKVQALKYHVGNILHVQERNGVVHLLPVLEVLSGEVVDEINVALGFAHRGLYLGGANGVHNDTGALELLCEGLGQPSYAPLCHAVGRQLRSAVHSRCGGDIDDTSEALLLHVDSRVLVGSPGADKVNVDNLLYLRVSKLPGVAEVDHAGVCNHHVDPSESIPRLLKESLHVVVRGDIRLYSERLCAELLYLCHRRAENLPGRVLHIRENYVKAVLRKLEGMCLALSHCAACDEYNFSFHFYFLLI